MMIKTSLLSAIALASAAAIGPVAAQPNGAPPPNYGPPPPGQEAQERFVARIMQADVNRDGRVTMHEWLQWRWANPARNPTDPRREFARMDVYHQGFLTPDELAAFAAQRAQMRDGYDPGPP